MSTTSSGAEAVAEWAENWLQTAHRDWQVHLTPVTAAYASMNLAGPRSRDLLRRVAEAWIWPRGVRLHARAHRAGGRREECVLWRIGFTGELSYEIHVPASTGSTSGRRCWPRQGPRRRAVRRRGAAHPPAGKGPPHRGPGHRRPDPEASAPAWAGRSSSIRTISPASRNWPGRQRTRTPAAGRRCSRWDGSVVPPEASQILRRQQHRRPDHLEPHVARAGPVHLPGPARRSPGNTGNAGGRAAARWPASPCPGDGRARSLRSGRGADACLT